MPPDRRRADEQPPAHIGTGQPLRHPGTPKPSLRESTSVRRTPPWVTVRVWATPRTTVVQVLARVQIWPAAVVCVVGCTSNPSTKGDPPGPASARRNAEREPDPTPEPKTKPVAGAEAERSWPEFDCDAIVAKPEGEADIQPARPGESSTAVARLAAVLGVAVDGELVVEGVQCSAEPGWGVTDPELADDRRTLISNGERVHVLGTNGVRSAQVNVERDRHAATVPTVEGSGRFELVARRSRPSSSAKLRNARLPPPGPQGAVAKAWVDAREGIPYRPVGTLTGSFGGEVDALVVVEPETIYPSDGPDQEPDLCTTEFVVALSGGTVTGVLPMGRRAGPESRRRCWCDEDTSVSLQGIEVAAVFDLDGDGTDEVAWVSQTLGGTLVTRVGVTYFSDGAFAHRWLASCSYNGCERFLGENDCGRSQVRLRANKRR